jgi:imidazolonepropionase-like amidohydrolase
MKTVILASLLISLTSAALGQDLAITHATVYASPEASARRDVTVVIRHGVITSVGEHILQPRGIETLDCPSCIVLAGFWNSHVHFMEPRWSDAAHQPAEKLNAYLSEMLTHSGFTTVVDTGSDGANTIALRRRVDSGEVSGPRILTAGLPIFPAHALPYYLADLPPDFKARLGQPATPLEAAAFVDANRSAGTDIVKLFTGSIVTPNHITPMRVEVARAAVDEAHRYGQLVFSHSTNLEGTRVALDAGVDVLAHTPEATEGIDSAFLRRMVTQHMTIIPTLKLFSRDDDIAKIRGLDLQFHQLGGRLVYGTDTGFLSDYDQGEEFRQLSQAGLGFRDILAMLTTAPVEIFHLSQQEGKVAPGMRGDLTVLAQDPSSGDPAAFTSIKYAIRGGKVIWPQPKTQQ